MSKEELHAGESDYAQLVCEHPLTARKKDRFVIRFLSPLESVGGGAVIHELPCKHKRKSESVLDEFEDEKWQEVLHALNDFHGQHPFLPGAPRLYLKNRCFATWDAPRVDAYLDFLVCEGRIGRGSPCGAAKRRSGCFMSGRSPKKSDLFRQKRNDDHKISEEEQ